MMTPLVIRHPITVDSILDSMQQLREDSFRKVISDLLAREADIDDWDQAMATVEAFREETANWREEARRQIEAEFAAMGLTNRGCHGTRESIQ